MRIAIVTLTTTARRTGVAEYLINLLEQLQRLDMQNEYYIFTGRDNRYMFDIYAPTFHEVKLPLTHASLQRPLFYFWLSFLLPLWCKRKKIDVVHLPNTLFVSGFFPSVSTIHDVVELKIAKYSALRTLFRKIMVKSAILRSQRIITVSQSSARDLVDLGAHRIQSIHLGFTNPYQSFSPVQQDEVILNKYELDKNKYLLFVGTMLRHKNIPTLIQSFSRVAGSNDILKLVLVGAPDNDYQNCVAIIEKLKLGKRVVLLNFVSHEEKLILLRNTLIFCFISSYEGFGIPILEAQAAQVPVIVNNTSSLPEVGGDGVYLVQPENLEEDTENAINELFHNPSLRADLVAKGVNNITRFLWEDFALKTLRVYNDFKKV